MQLVRGSVRTMPYEVAALTPFLCVCSCWISARIRTAAFHVQRIEFVVVCRSVLSDKGIWENSQTWPDSGQGGKHKLGRH
jgi:hypothetical protein